MFRLAASIGVLLMIGAAQPNPPLLPSDNGSVRGDAVGPALETGGAVASIGSESESRRTPETPKKKHRNLPPDWREQFAAAQDQNPPRIDRVTPHPGGWIVDDIGLDHVQIGFTEAVSIPAGAVSAWTLTGGTVSNFTTSYDATTNMLTVNFGSPVRDNRLTLIVDYAVTDLAGNQLDGEINNPSNPTLPSGDGFRGGQAVFRFNILQGDANRDGIVNAADAGLIQPLLGVCADEPGFNPLADLNVDGCVNVIDAGIYRLAEGRTLPATDGAPPFQVTILEPENNSLLRDMFTLRLVFNETMLPSRINTRTCFVVDQNGSVIVPQLVALGGFGDIIVYTFNPPLPQCGSYRLGISNALADFSGELLSAPTTPPVISGFVGPPAPTLNAHTTSTKNPTVTITGTASGADSVEVSGPMGVFTVPVTNNSFSVDFTQYPLSDNRVNATFFTGLSRCDGIRSPPTRTAITRDNQPPTLFIDFPTDGASITTNGTDVAGRVGDVLSGYQGLTVTVNGTAAVVNEGIGTNGTFFAPSVPLNPNQANTILVTATDQLGNSVTKQIMITQAPVPSGIQRMQKFSGNGQSNPIHTLLPQPIVVQVLREDGTTPLPNKWVKFEVTRSNGRLSGAAGYTCMGYGTAILQCQTDATGKVRVNWTLGDDAGEGNNRVRVTATEIAGTVEFCATASAGPIKQINVGMGNNQIVEVGAPAPEPLIAWVNDACNGNCPVQVTFTVVEGGGKVTGNTLPLPCNASDPMPPSFFTGQSVAVYTSRTGHAEVRFTAGPNPGNNRITASVTGLNTPATFIVYGVKRDANKPTSFTGLVVDNGTQPIQGAECTLFIPCIGQPGNRWQRTALSEPNGQFHFNEQTPVGGIPEQCSGPAALTVDGFSATHIGGHPGVDVLPQTYPSLHYETIVIPNAENSLPTPVRLPKMDECNRAYYSQAVDTILTIRRRNPAVTDPNDPNYCLPAIDGLRFIVKAGSMSIYGQPAPEGSLLMLNQVHHDDIPMPLPDGAAPPMTGTLWPPYAKFDPPIAVEFPNMVGLPPGAIAYFLSFDHDTSRFEIVASGHVTADGSLIVTDPGVGIPHGGWHGNCPPYSVTGDCERCEGAGYCCNDRCCGGSNCCGSPDPCCDPGSPCCHSPNRCCNPDNPCCGSPNPCCNPSDPCCQTPKNRCCNPDNPCCKSSDPCCNPSDPCCGTSDACCNPDNPCCIAVVSTADADDAGPTLVVAGPSEPCCDDDDPCCNNPDPCCGVNCNDGNPCTQDTCDENGECQHPCLPDCGGCGQNMACFNCGCVSGNCSFNVIEEDGCPGGTVELELLGSCSPDCGAMTFSMVKSVQYLDVTLPGSIPCDGTVQQETVTVRIDEDAPPGPRQFRIIGTTPLAQCEDTVNMNIVECVDLTFDAVPDDQETNPGGFLCVNDDDDDDNGTPDKDDPGPTVNENDLKPLVLSLNPGWTQAGVVLLQCKAGCDKVKFYENPDRSNPFTLPIQWSVPHPDLPKTLYVEGVKKSTAPRDVEIEARFNGGGTECRDVVKLTVVGIASMVPDTPSKVLISMLHGGGYPSAQQTSDRKIRVKAILQPPIVGQKVYFRSFDPDDESPYESDSPPIGDDNRHAALRRGNLELPTGYVEVAGSRQLDTDGNAIELGIVSTTGGVAEVDLQITDRYGGDNYLVAAHCGPKPALTNVTTANLVAWKRVYLERDSMYVKGGTITVSFTPDANTADDVLTLDSTVDFTVGDMITIFSPTGTLDTVVRGKTSSTLSVPDLASGFPRFSGVRLTADTTMYTVTTSLFPAAYGSDPDGRDGGAFVEYMDSPSGSSGVPKYTSFPADGDITSFAFCKVWFDNASSSANVFQLVAAYKHDDGSFGTTNPGMNISFITTGNFSFGATNAAAIDETAVHEIAHQFGVANSHVDVNVAAPNYLMTDDCVMSYHRVRDNSIVEFETDCFYDIRDQTNAP
jgi:hypothetical protein